MIWLNRRLLALFTLLVLSASLQSFAAVALPFGHGLLFKITAPDGRVSHIFGTIHSDDPRVQTLAEPVDRVFSRATRVALEIKMGPVVAVALMGAMINADGRTLESIIGIDLYQRVAKVASTRGIPEIGLRQFKPWAVATMLGMPPSKSGQFLDLILFQRAQASGVEVVGLETVQEQLAVFDGLSDVEQIAIVEDMLNNFPKMPIIHEKLLVLYLNKNLQGLVALNGDLSRGENEALMARFQKALIDERNRRMVDRIEAYLVDGLFVAVGALHLPGPLGVLSLMQQKGYQIQRVY